MYVEVEFSLTSDHMSASGLRPCANHLAGENRGRGQQIGFRHHFAESHIKRWQQIVKLWFVDIREMKLNEVVCACHPFCATRTVSLQNVCLLFFYVCVSVSHGPLKQIAGRLSLSLLDNVK